jgi:hypothetical protein
MSRRRRLMEQQDSRYRCLGHTLRSGPSNGCVVQRHSVGIRHPRYIACHGVAHSRSGSVPSKPWQLDSTVTAFGASDVFSIALSSAVHVGHLQ